MLRYLADPDRPARLDRLVEDYRRRRDSFAVAMTRRLRGLAEWQVPPGGLFFWATLRSCMDAEALLARARQRMVLFAPGVHFLVHPADAEPAMRLNFSHADEEAADRGLAVLEELLREG